MTPPRPTDTAAGTTPLWISHHQPEAYDRCLTVAGRHVCRRCAVLYPVTFLVLGVVLAAGVEPGDADPWLLAILPLPAVIEWWAEHLGRIRYSPIRQAATSVPLGVALGLGLGRYLSDPADPVFWAMVVLYGGSCLAVVLWRFLDERAP